jgi:hypothetical protein
LSFQENNNIARVYACWDLKVKVNQ